MGMSKRNLNDSIRKILKEEGQDSINNTAPKLTKKILTKKYLMEKFGPESDIETSIHIISKNFISLGSGGFKGKSKKELLEDPISQQEFLEMILNEIENENIISSMILEKSLKIVMSEFLNNEEFDTYSFAQLLFYRVIFEMLTEQLYDNIKDIFEDLSYDLIQKMIHSATDKIMNESIYSKVNLFIDRKLPLENLLEEISNQTSKATFGDF